MRGRPLYRNTQHRSPKRPGPSSFWMHDPEVVFNALGLREGDVFLDLGCGPGDYSLLAADHVGVSGSVYALDISQRMLGALRTEAVTRGIPNIMAVVGDITRALPVPDSRADACLIATVLHIPGVARNRAALLREVHRVLKPSGQLGIMECKKADMPMGPPLHMRLSPGEIERCVKPHGFKMVKAVDLGCFYFSLFGTI